MSSFNFLDDEVSEVEKANKDLAQLDRQPGDPGVAAVAAVAAMAWGIGDGRVETRPRLTSNAPRCHRMPQEIPRIC